MTDEQFMTELWIYCYKTQIDGYPLGHPYRKGFRPIVPSIGRDPVNREATLGLASYDEFTEEQKKLLLEPVSA